MNDGSGKAHGWDLYFVLPNTLPDVTYTIFVIEALRINTAIFHTMNFHESYAINRS